MKPRPPHRRGSRSGPPADPVEALRDYAIKLRDRGDGHGTDWPRVAADAFMVAFYALDQAPGDERALRAMRKAEGGLYNRLAGNPDDGTPFPAGRPAEPDITLDAAPRPGPGPRH